MCVCVCVCVCLFWVVAQVARQGDFLRAASGIACNQLLLPALWTHLLVQASRVE